MENRMEHREAARSSNLGRVKLMAPGTSEAAALEI
jgi:hypothetical protein